MPSGAEPSSLMSCAVQVEAEGREAARLVAHRGRRVERHVVADVVGERDARREVAPVGRVADGAVGEELVVEVVAERAAGVEDPARHLLLVEGVARARGQVQPVADRPGEVAVHGPAAALDVHEAALDLALEDVGRVDVVLPVGILEVRVVAARDRPDDPVEVRRLGDADRAAERILVVDVVEHPVDRLLVDAGAHEPGDRAVARRVEPEFLAPVLDLVDLAVVVHALRAAVVVLEIVEVELLVAGERGRPYSRPRASSRAGAAPRTRPTR